jgi:hypothetical protein
MTPEKLTKQTILKIIVALTEGIIIVSAVGKRTEVISNSI